MIPLYGFLEGDTLGLLVLAYEDETIAQLAEKLQKSARIRVSPLARPRVLLNGVELPAREKIKSTALKALDRFDVVEGDA